MQNQNDKHNTFVSHKSRRPPTCTTEKFIQNYVPQQRPVPGIIYASETKKKNGKVCLIGDSHLKRINKRKFRKKLGKRLIYFKCFSSLYTKQLHYYIVPTLNDETL